MQRRNRWIFLLTGCSIVVYALLRLLQAEYSALLTLFTAWVWFFLAYRPPQFRSMGSVCSSNVGVGGGKCIK